MNRQTARGTRRTGILIGAAAATIVAILAGSASASAPGFKTYAGCGATAHTAPSHHCQIGEQVGLFFQSNTDTTYDLCLTTPRNTSCTHGEEAQAGTLYVNKALVSTPGRYFVTWTVGEGTSAVGHWTYTISEPYWETCEGSSLPSELRVHRMTCQSGEKIIKRFAAKAQEHGPHIRVNGFHCNAHGAAIACYRGKQRVTYAGGF